MTPEPSTPDLILRLTLTSDWGVATGAGVAGGVDAVIERGGDGRPVVRGTVITGLMREQALNAAHALDGARPDGPWAALATTLFGTPTQPRLVAFSDAPVSVTPATAPDGRPRPATHEVVGVSIDAETGTAKDDFLRFLERAGSGVGESAVTLLTETLDRTPVTWSPRQYADARLLLALAAQLVTAVGSDRSNGDGACQALLCDDDAELGRQWCAEVVRRLRAPGAVRAPHLPTLATSEPARLAAPAGAARTGGGAPAPAGTAPGGAPGAVGRSARPGPAMAAEPGPAMAAELTLTIVLTTPLVSYDVPYSNEVRSLDFLRGTVLLPWVHSRLRHAFVGSDLVRDAVVTGRLRVSDATPVVGGVRGLPVPLVLSRPKVPGARQETLEIWNRLLRGEPSEVHVPLRSGYVFYPDPGADAATGAPGGTTPGSATASGPTVCLGAPALTGRQSTAMDAATGTVATGQLFMVRAIPAGVTLQAQVSLSADLYDTVGPRLDELLSVPARLGSRRFSGSYGQVVCQAGRADTGLRAGGRTEVGGHPGAGGRTEGGRATSRPGPGGAPGGASAPGGAGGAAGDGVTVWCTSDLLLRSPRLGPVDGMTGLLRALGGGIELELVGSSGPLAPGPHLTPAPRGPGGGGARALRPGGSPGLPAVVGRAQDARYSAGLRYRRVDGWSAADQQPRASRVAVQAGSTLRVRPTDPGAMGSLRRHLARLERDGVGLLREQGYGRIAVGHPFLGPGPDVIRARVLQQSDFTTEGQGQ